MTFLESSSNLDSVPFSLVSSLKLGLQVCNSQFHTAEAWTRPEPLAQIPRSRAITPLTTDRAERHFPIGLLWNDHVPIEVVPIAQRTDMLNHGFAPPPIGGLSVLKCSNLLLDIFDQL